LDYFAHKGRGFYLSPFPLPLLHKFPRRYEVEITPDLVEKDDDGWYPPRRMHYYLTLEREFLTNRDAKRAAAQLEAGENSIYQPDFNIKKYHISIII
jgi:hypothetical protein